MARNKALNPTVVRLGLVSLFADISSEMLYPITPFLLTTILGASMTSVGLIEGTAEAIASLLKTYSGFWSDRLKKRKAFISYGYFLSAIAKPITGLAQSWGVVFLARALDRTGKGLRSAPRDALLADSVSPELRGIAFGWHRAMDTLGAAIGPLLAFAYLSYFKDNIRPIFYVSLIPGLIAVIITDRVKEAKAPDSKSQAQDVHTFSGRLSSLSKDFKKYLLGWGVFYLANSSDVFLIMKVKSEGFDLKDVILVYCFYNLVYSLSSPYLGHLSDRFGRKKILISGLSIFSAVYFLFTLAHSPWHFWMLFGVYGLYMGATDGVGKAGAIDLVEPHLKATAIGLLGTVTGIATLFASVTAGFLWDHLGSNYPFYFGAAGSFVAIFIFYSNLWTRDRQ